MKSCPAYGAYCPTDNAFGVGFYHGWTTGLHCSPREAEDYFRRIDVEPTGERIKLYLNGRDDGVARDTCRVTP